MTGLARRGLEPAEHRSLLRRPGLTIFAEPGPRRTRAHTMPVWKLVLGRDAPLLVDSPGGVRTGWALLVPPGTPNRAETAGAYVAAFVDPGQALAARQVVDLGRRRGRLLLDELEAVGNLDLTDLLTPDPHPLGRALRHLTRDTTIDALAVTLGVGPQQARRLIREHTGATFRELLRWTRLRAAVMGLADAPIAQAAAEAGFADQAHFTRTSAAVLGRTPGSLAPRS